MTKSGLQIRLLGPLAVSRNGAPVTLPRSRKVRALLAYLVLSPAPALRSRLCDLLWDVPNDPRGELRWCLSKIRGVLGEAAPIVDSPPDAIRLSVSNAQIDVLELQAAANDDFRGASPADLEWLARSIDGRFLEGEQLEASSEFNGWLVAQRERLRLLQVSLFAELSKRSSPGSPERLIYLQKWLQFAPHDLPPHEALLQTLVGRGRAHDAEEHVHATMRAFEQEGVDWQPLRECWHALRSGMSESRARVIEASAAREQPRSARGDRPVRASVAVMPFAERGATNRIGDGLTDDIITRLAKLRVLFVIARGTVFSLNDRNIDPQEAARILSVDYVVSGAVKHAGERTTLRVELAETRGGGIVWTDEFEARASDAFLMLDGIVDRVVTAIAEEIEAAECRRAVLKAPSSLDAWEAYHRGLWHMYKFTGSDNQHAERFFRSALDLDPTFARAYAGLSFTHFQNAFLDLTPDRTQQIEHAFQAAGRSLSADDRDPAAHWAMGRALWLRGAQAESLSELQRSIELSPNFALGHYTLGFVHSQKGDPGCAIEATDYARSLSPFDPLQFAMLASRAMAHVRLGEFEEAASWAVKATARPNAHQHILAIAAECLALAQRCDEARGFAARIRTQKPSYTVDDFLRAFCFDSDVERLFRDGARQFGFD